MVSSSSAVAVAARAPITQERIERVFYLLAGCLLLVIVAMGFQKFYLHGRASNGGPVTQEIVPLVFLHGVAMSAWIIAFVVQSSLIVSGNRKLHMSLGIAGIVLAAFLVIVGVTTAIASVHYNPDGYKDLWSARRFLSFMLTNILGFGILAASGLTARVVIGWNSKHRIQFTGMHLVRSRRVHRVVLLRLSSPPGVQKSFV
jgi:FtsH-binding integral membrane protein